MFSQMEKNIILQAVIMAINSKDKTFKVKAVERLLKEKPEAQKVIDELIDVTNSRD